MMLLLTEIIALTFNVVWFTGDCTEPILLRKQKRLNESLIYSPWGGGGITILFAFPYSPLERDVYKAVSRCSDHKPVSQRDWLFDSEWSRAAVKLGARDRGVIRAECHWGQAPARSSSWSWSWFVYVSRLLFFLFKSLTNCLFLAGICIPVTESILTPHIPALEGPRNKKNGHYASKDLGWQNLGRSRSKLSHIKGKITFALHCFVPSCYESCYCC